MTTGTRTTCPFCLNGCESEVVFDYQYRMEYPREAPVNGGRLCPRGNSANLVLDHPKRLGYPLLDGREVSWDRAIEYCRDAVRAAQPAGRAVVYSRGYPESEYALIRGFARALGTSWLACGYLEPGNWFGLMLDGVKAATLDSVRRAQVTLLAGDVFGTSPVAAGPILDARYADRKNRLVVIDSVQTRQAGFSHLFVRVRPGTEPLALIGIAAALDASLGVDVGRCAAVAGVETGQLQSVANMLKAGPAFIGGAMCLGRTSRPTLFSLASQLVALKSGATFTGYAEARVPLSATGFPALRQAMASGSIRTLFWFGGLHPFSYPELLPEAANVEFPIATSIFRPGVPFRGLLLPVPSELEKESNAASYWGEVRRQPLAAHYSGSRPIRSFLADITEVGAVGAEPIRPSGIDDVTRLARAELAVADPDVPLLLVGEKRAIGIAGFFDRESDVTINPRDCARAGIDPQGCAVIRTLSGERGFRVGASGAVPEGVISVGVNAHANRVLFPLGVDAAGAATFPPVAVELGASTAGQAYAVERKADA